MKNGENFINERSPGGRGENVAQKVLVTLIIFLTLLKMRQKTGLLIKMNFTHRFKYMNSPEYTAGMFFFFALRASHNFTTSFAKNLIVITPERLEQVHRFKV